MSYPSTPAFRHELVSDQHDAPPEQGSIETHTLLATFFFPAGEYETWSVKNFEWDWKLIEVEISLKSQKTTKPNKTKQKQKSQTSECCMAQRRSQSLFCQRKQSQESQIYSFSMKATITKPKTQKQQPRCSLSESVRVKM